MVEPYEYGFTAYELAELNKSRTKKRRSTKVEVVELHAENDYLRQLLYKYVLHIEAEGGVDYLDHVPGQPPPSYGSQQNKLTMEDADAIREIVLAQEQKGLNDVSSQQEA